MNDLIEFLTSEEMIIVGVVALIGCFLAFIVYLSEKRFYKRRQKQNTKELNNLVSDIKEVEEEYQSVESINPVVSPNAVVNEKIESEVNTVPIEKTEEVAPIVEKIVLTDDIEKEEKPLVIPIEELEQKESTSIENIYSDVKEHIETLDDTEEELEYTSVEPNQEEAREELRKVTENLIKKEEEQKELENIELTKFEEEQEENAIISLDELMKKSNELYEKNEVSQYEDEGNEPISLQDLELRMNNIKEEIKNLDIEETKVVPIQEEIAEVKSEKVVLDDFNTITDPDKIYRNDVVFKSSPIISPIFGIENKSLSSNNIALENTANYEKLDEEIKKTNEFLVTLKELQKKLD